MRRDIIFGAAAALALSWVSPGLRAQEPSLPVGPDLENVLTKIKDSTQEHSPIRSRRVGTLTTKTFTIQTKRRCKN